MFSPMRISYCLEAPPPSCVPHPRIMLSSPPRVPLNAMPRFALSVPTGAAGFFRLRISAQLLLLVVLPPSSFLRIELISGGFGTVIWFFQWRPDPMPSCIRFSTFSFSFRALDMRCTYLSIACLFVPSSRYREVDAFSRRTTGRSCVTSRGLNVHSSAPSSFRFSRISLSRCVFASSQASVRRTRSPSRASGAVHTSRATS